MQSVACKEVLSQSAAVMSSERPTRAELRRTNIRLRLKPAGLAVIASNVMAPVRASNLVPMYKRTTKMAAVH